MNRSLLVRLFTFLPAIVWSILGAPPATRPLIPRSALLVEPDRTSIQLSPDGLRVGWISTSAAGRTLLWRDLSSGREVTLPLQNPLVSWQWSRSSDSILAVLRNETGQMLSIVPVGPDELPTVRRPRVLCEGSRVRVLACGVEEVLVSLTESGARSTSLFRIRLDGSARKKVIDAGEYDNWWADASLRIVAARRPTGEGFAVDRLLPSGTREPIFEAGLLDGLSSGVVSVSSDGTKLWYVSGANSETSALYECDLRTGSKRFLMKDPGADLLPVSAVIDQKTGRPLSVVSYHVRLERHFLDGVMKEDFDRLGKIRNGDVSLAGQSVDNTRWLIRWLDGGPAHYAVWDRTARRTIDLFDDVSGLTNATLASRRPLVLRSRDGLNLNCDLYLPPHTDILASGRPAAPLPTVVYVHGGPWTGFEWNIWGANRNFQLLANRGYAVIRAGFRGEAGYGRKYIDAGDREWGGAMHTDILDIVEHATKTGITAPDRVAIWGWSYGGYEAAFALAATPATFACGIAMYGVYDFEGFLRTPFADNAFWRQRVGDVESPNDLLRIQRVSPVRLASAVKHPLLMTHGALDDRVPISQSDSLVEALRKEGKAVTYLIFPDEGHDYGRLENWRAFWATGEAFLQQHLHGAAEPPADDLKQARVEIRVDPRSRG